jgi:NAD(P)-dependent dehydrogenase (short-subunit alcohol dehydrogenase family)
MTTSLKGQIAWITGGGSGIGLAGAMALAKNGVHVVISGRNAATNASALATLQTLGSAEALLLDVADKHAVKAAAQQILDKHGRIDILVTSAGTNATQRNFDVVTPEAWDDVVAINLSGLFYCVHAVLPAMRQQQSGLIINVSSWAGLYASKLPGLQRHQTRRAGPDRVHQHGRMHARHPRHLALARRGGHAHSEQTARPAVCRAARAHGPGRRHGPGHLVCGANA